MKHWSNNSLSNMVISRDRCKCYPYLRKAKTFSPSDNVNLPACLSEVVNSHQIAQHRYSTGTHEAFETWKTPQWFIKNTGRSFATFRTHLGKYFQLDWREKATIQMIQISKRRKGTFCCCCAKSLICMRGATFVVVWWWLCLRYKGQHDVLFCGQSFSLIHHLLTEEDLRSSKDIDWAKRLIIWLLTKSE